MMGTLVHGGLVMMTIIMKVDVHGNNNRGDGYGSFNFLIASR